MRKALRRVALGILLSLTLAGFGFPRGGPALPPDFDALSLDGRAEALRGLVESRHPGTEQALRRGLSDPEAFVRLTAAEVIVALQRTSLSPALAQGIESREPAVRAAFARALGALGAQEQVPTLTRALSDVDAGVRAAAAEALGRLKASEVLPSLLDHLSEPDTGARLAVVEALAAIADRSAALPLLGCVRDPVPEVRAAVLRALGRVGDPVAVGGVLRAMDDPASEVALAAVIALGLLPTEESRQALREATHADDPRRARAAYAALSGMPADAAVAPLLEGAREPALRELTPAALARVLEREPDARGLAARALASALRSASTPAHALTLVRAGLGAGLVPDDSPRWRDALLAWLERADRPAAPLLRALGKSREDRVCLRVLDVTDLRPPLPEAALIEALEECMPDGATLYADPLLAWLPRVSPSRRAAVVRLIGRSGAAEAVAPLVPLLSDAAPRVRLSASRALAALGDARAVLQLRAKLDVGERRERVAAGRALGELCDPSVLADLLARPHVSQEPGSLEGVRRCLTRGVRPPPEGVSPLRAKLAELALLGDDEAQAARALDALAALGDDGSVAIVRSVDERHPRVRRVAAVRALATLSPSQAASALRARARAKDDPRVASEALLALVPLTTLDADRTWLAALAREGAWPTRVAAAYALARLVLRTPPSPGDAALFCELAQARDPGVAANGLAALAALPGAACLGALDTWAARVPKDLRVAAAVHALRPPPEGEATRAPGAADRCEATRVSGVWLAFQEGNGTTAVTERDALGRPAAQVDHAAWCGSPWSPGNWFAQ